MSATTRALVAAMLLVAPLLHGADEQAPPVPQPTLPPEARTLQIRPSSDDSQRSRASSAQPAALVDDISALKQAVERVRRVRNQFTEKDILFRVKRMDHQAEKFFGFGLKCKSFSGCHGSLLNRKLLFDKMPAPAGTG